MTKSCFQINIGSRRPRTQFSDMLDIQVKSDPDGNPKDRDVVLSIFSDILPKWLVYCSLGSLENLSGESVTDFSYEYDPEMVFVHYPLSSGLMSESGAATLIHHLSSLARGKLVVVFEAENGTIERHRRDSHI